MKKFLSFLLAVALVLPNFLTLQASATGVELSEYDQLIALAKETFPEYVDKLDGNLSSRNIEPQTKTSEINAVIQETRTVDNNTSMTYTEYNNGIVTLGMARFVKNADLIIEDSVTHSTYEQFTAKIVASVVEGPTFTATGVQYRIYPSNYDRLISAGNYGIPGYTSDQFDCYIRSIETDSTPAGVAYSFACPVGTLYYSGSVDLTISNNVASVDFYIW